MPSWNPLFKRRFKIIYYYIDGLCNVASPCGICGWQGGNGKGFSPSTSVSPCQIHSANTVYSVFIYLPPKLYTYSITISQISPTSCTILFNIFTSLLYMFRASMYPSSGQNYCIYATLVFVTLCGWLLVCWLEWNFSLTSRPDATHSEWQTPVSRRYNFLLMMGTWMPETCREVK